MANVCLPSHGGFKAHEGPGDSKCKLVIMGPVGQRADLLNASVDHAVKTHGREDSKELRATHDKLIQPFEP